eukprot:TRINITY_DN21849_c0_g1_i1.p2 TRINITY_DN21849_c0_g1~~TRINITY_DN21849_c0_g1_i1.p2  ORF type:complete len:457 (+),score=107.29 TRINITY_DN21849_c0_g1_i1:123-1493(+)
MDALCRAFAELSTAAGGTPGVGRAGGAGRSAGGGCFTARSCRGAPRRAPRPAPYSVTQQGARRGDAQSGRPSLDADGELAELFSRCSLALRRGVPPQPHMQATGTAAPTQGSAQVMACAAAAGARWSNAPLSAVREYMQQGAADDSPKAVPWAVCRAESRGGAPADGICFVAPSASQYPDGDPVVYAPHIPAGTTDFALLMRQCETAFKALWEGAHVLGLRTTHGSGAYHARLRHSCRLLRALAVAHERGTVPEIEAPQRRLRIGAYSVAVDECGRAVHACLVRVESPAGATTQLVPRPLALAGGKEACFRPGQRLEAVELKTELRCVATVANVRDDLGGRWVLLHFDGCSKKLDYWCRHDSGRIAPAGTCRARNYRLQGPKGERWYGWQAYLDRVRAEAAPAAAFGAWAAHTEPWLHDTPDAPVHNCARGYEEHDAPPWYALSSPPDDALDGMQQ